MKRCPKCKQQYEATLKFFFADKSHKDGLGSWCKLCKRAANDTYKETPKGRAVTLEAKRAYYHTEGGAVMQRKQDLKKKYGISLEDYDRMLVEQEGKCLICGDGPGKKPGKKKYLGVDHDHITGAVRGLLCTGCNLMIGYAHDNVDILTKAIHYLM